MIKNVASKGSTMVKTQIRVPKDLHEKLTASAAVSGRSFNAEMIYRLAVSYPLQDIAENHAQIAQNYDVMIENYEKQAHSTEAVIKMMAMDKMGMDTGGIAAEIYDRFGAQITASLSSVTKDASGRIVQTRARAPKANVKKAAKR